MANGLSYNSPNFIHFQNCGCLMVKLGILHYDITIEEYNIFSNRCLYAKCCGIPKAGSLPVNVCAIVRRMR